VSRLRAENTSTRGLALKVLGACFERHGCELVAPFDLTLAAGERRVLLQPNPRAASIAARIAAAIVKPTAGVVYVGDFDARLQPAQAKRRVGFVPTGGFAGNQHAFQCQVGLRSEVWGIDPREARRRVAGVLEAFGDDEEPCARALALALIPPVSLVILDQPARAFDERIDELAPGAAVLTTEAAGPTALGLLIPTLSGAR
jgi:ABC-type multidrug transport system ATPase subunit